MVALPHGAFEGWLLSRREPFGSLDLFWLPGILYLSLGTIWQYFWPWILLRVHRWVSKRGVQARS